jgi:hypothetical protein
MHKWSTCCLTFDMSGPPLAWPTQRNMNLGSGVGQAGGGPLDGRVRPRQHQFAPVLPSGTRRLQLRRLWEAMLRSAGSGTFLGPCHLRLSNRVILDYQIPRITGLSAEFAWRSEVLTGAEAFADTLSAPVPSSAEYQSGGAPARARQGMRAHTGVFDVQSQRRTASG